MDATSRGGGAVETAIADLYSKTRHIRKAVADDHIAGMPAQAVAEPEREEEVAAILRAASAAGLAVSPWGGGTQLDIGFRPRKVDLILRMERLNQIVEHAPHDLTVTVQAGARITDLQARLAEANQWLALDPPLDPAATVGGLISTNASGPRRLRYGGVRDQIIGVRVALPDGTIARGGGKVVKNVAGYDLPKLYTGALGTLGIVLSASFRLYPHPAHSGSALVAAETPQEACSLAVAILAQPLTPTVMDVFPPSATADSEHNSGSIGPSYTLAVRFESSVEEAVEAQIAVVKRLAQESNAACERRLGVDDSAWWSARDDWMWGAGAASPTVAAGAATTVASSEALANIKASLLPADVGAWLALLEATCERRGLATRWRAHAGHGLIFAHLFIASEGSAPHASSASSGEQIDDLAETINSVRAAATERRGSLVVTSMTPEARERVDPWGPAQGIATMRRLKERFDPQNIMNPGRFVGGI